MSRLITKQETIEQSNRAYGRWGELWHENARRNSAIKQQNPSIASTKKGKKLILCAFGGSLQENLIDIKNNKLHHEYDIMVVDKALHTVLKHGIVPEFVYVADAQISFEKYGEINPSIIPRVNLVSCIVANYKWSEYWAKNGGKIHYTLNKDAIRTHHVYGKYIKDQQHYIIPAASNVANSAYVFATLVLGYSEILFAGFDYSFKLNGAYYGDQDSDGAPRDTNYDLPKKHMYNHITVVDINNDLVQASNNMYFSARWLIDFVNTLEQEGKNITINITGHGILRIPNLARLKKGVA